MNRKFYTLRTFSVLAAALLIAACSDRGAMAPEMPTLEPSEAIFGTRYRTVQTSGGPEKVCTFTSNPGGGTARCGPHKVVVPPGALRGHTSFRVELRPEMAAASFSATSVGSKVENDVGAAGFKRPLTFVFDYSYIEQQIDNESQLRMGLIVDGQVVEMVGSKVDMDANLLSGNLKHFSTYGLIAP